MELMSRVRNLEARLLRKGERVAVVFGVAPSELWEEDEPSFKGIPFELYLCSASVMEYVRQARDLAELEDLAKRHSFRLSVLPTTVSQEDLWREEAGLNHA